MLKTKVDVDQAAVILKLLGDRTRLTMVKLLENHDCCVCEFVEIFDMSQPSVSQHLKKLKQVGIVKEKRKGSWVFYSLNKESEFTIFIERLLDEIPNQDDKLEALEKNGKRITCC
ncbi:ArsR/SmtB family transcription factor [Saliterribacillus persicus]|uniref:ArsR family transcriptional regulator n=1 Tax=Saliterribacillus persicus TaxID=930114 RepID=A0A368XP79_9BACI|nr:metalloregulator ArsR/SmtB family transcription factor [Saliterribacillus persicus]RCW69810.1 ArsR family transcriptional regulator [Saliterribacillus persicus]